jgi:hypothetical protein
VTVGSVTYVAATGVLQITDLVIANANQIYYLLVESGLAGNRALRRI